MATAGVAPEEVEDQQYQGHGEHCRHRSQGSNKETANYYLHKMGFEKMVEEDKNGTNFPRDKRNRKEDRKEIHAGGNLKAKKKKVGSNHLKQVARGQNRVKGA